MLGKIKDWIKCNPKLEGILIALGVKYAVGDLYGIVQIKGILAYLTKNMYFLLIETPYLN
jgi:NADH dehydrogenase